MANRWRNSRNSNRLYFEGAAKSLQMVIAAMKLKRRLLLGRKVMTNLDSIFKSRDITLPTKVRLVSSVQLLIRVPLYETLLIAALQASLSITNSRSSLRFMSIESVMPSSHLILCHSLFLLPPIHAASECFQ